MGRGNLLFAFLVVYSATPGASAYTRTLTTEGLPVRWEGERKINFAGLPQNSSGLSEASVYGAVVRGLQRWEKASGGAVTFDYWQGNDRATFEANSEYNGLSSIYFASASGESMDSSVIGLTQVWYDTDSGEIIETDIALNDRNYVFTTDTSDSSASAGGTGAMSVFIENVLTHEIGHAYGLSHSGVLQSTMLFMEAFEQAHLSCDDTAAIRALYRGDTADGTSSIRGSVKAEGGAAVFGAEVLAISRRRGVVVASALTDRSGRYTISGLEPGAYFLVAQPYYPGASALSSYYEGSSSSICGGSPFSRSFLTGSDGFSLSTVSVSSGGTADAKSLTARCSGSGGAAVGFVPEAGSSLATAAQINASSAGFGVVDRVSSTGQAAYYRIEAVGGKVEVRALAYTLYSPVRVSVSIVDSSGNPVPSRKGEPVYSSSSGYVNYDSAVIAEDLPEDDYYVKVTSTGLGSSVYPAGSVSLDSVPFVVLTGTFNASTPALTSIMPFNARCRMSERFEDYASPGGEPPRRDTEDDGGVGFCGTISAQGGSGPTGSAILGWFAPWMLMALMGLVARSIPARVPTPA